MLRLDRTIQLRKTSHLPSNLDRDLSNIHVYLEDIGKVRIRGNVRDGYGTLGERSYRLIWGV